MALVNKATTIGAPEVTQYQDLEDDLFVWWEASATAEAPVTNATIKGIQSVDFADPTFDTTEIRQAGSGGAECEIRRNFRQEITINVHPGARDDVLAQLKNRTWSSSNAMVPTYDSSPAAKGHLCWFRRNPDTSNLCSYFIWDLIIDDTGISGAIGGDGDQAINAHTFHPIVLLDGTVEPVVDTFNGDGSTTAFTLSSTPATLGDVSNTGDSDCALLDTVVFVKEDAEVKKSGYSESTGTLTATTAPASGVLVEVAYAKVSS